MFNPENFDEKQLFEAAKYLSEVPYDVSRTHLYKACELFDTFDVNNPASLADCYDTRVVKHLDETGVTPESPLEMWARSLHDYRIRKALYLFLGWFEANNIVGVMGGHSLRRTDATYRQVVDLAKSLTERGRVLMSGGGPGAMEATHLGAWLAGRTVADVEEALAILADAPTAKDDGWLATAFKVVERFPQVGDSASLAIPTWFYSDEPPTPFATHIAKFFENSIREDVLLSEAVGGIVFMPGGAGTLQEVFQEAVQNHYLTQGVASPMVFMDSQFWSKDVPIYPLLQKLIDDGRYEHLPIALVDDVESAIQTLDFCHGY